MEQSNHATIKGIRSAGERRCVPATEDGEGRFEIPGFLLYSMLLLCLFVSCLLLKRGQHQRWEQRDTCHRDTNNRALAPFRITSASSLAGL